VIDRVLTRCGIDTRDLNLKMELNSIEAIKNAVQSGLGAAFVSVTAIEKELKMGVLHRAHVKDLEVKRNLSVIINSNRYRSKAADAFIREILPQFCTEKHKEALNQLFKAQKVFLETNSNVEVTET
jgi:DNA-binding transcriptional LysR family regulator